MEVDQVIVDTIDGIDCNILIVSNEPHICVSDLYNQMHMPRMTLNDIIEKVKKDHPDCVIQVNGNDLQFDDCQPRRNFRQGGFQKNTINNIYILYKQTTTYNW